MAFGKITLSVLTLLKGSQIEFVRVKHERLSSLKRAYSIDSDCSQALLVQRATCHGKFSDPCISTKTSILSAI